MSYELHPNGIVLVVVVYIVTALGVLIFALALRSRMAIRESTHLIEMVQQEQIARAACAQARSMLADDDSSIDCIDERWSGWHELIPHEISVTSAETASDWQVYFRLVDESSKVNLNIAEPDLLLGLECMDEAAVASILDWLDEDDIPGPDGAENDYYTALEPPYKCRNAPVENIEELLLIKGVSPKIYYGSSPDERSTALTEWDIDSTDFTVEDFQNGSAGLTDLLTIYGDGRFNINTASKPVLDAIPLLSDGAVSEIISRQKSYDDKFSSMDDIENNVHFTDADKLSLKQVAKFNSNHFRLRIMVRKKGQQFFSEYLAVIERDRMNTKLLSWQRKPRNVLKAQVFYTAGNNETFDSKELQ